MTDLRERGRDIIAARKEKKQAVQLPSRFGPPPRSSKLATPSYKALLKEPPVRKVKKQALAKDGRK